MPDKTYTTSEIAKICDVYPSSVIHWINAGKLKAYSTPGRHHRVTREDLLVFLKSLNVPIPPDLQDGRAKTALIVEDDPELAPILIKACAERGFVVEACDNGVEALIRLGQTPAPDVVILDIVLPKMDGEQICRILKAKPETRGIKIVAISGHGAPAGLAADGFFAKPLDVLDVAQFAAGLVSLAQEAKP
jgi:two-component system, OmpR family, response regulator VicR